VGDFCNAICDDCLNAAINVSVEAQYQAELRGSQRLSFQH